MIEVYKKNPWKPPTTKNVKLNVDGTILDKFTTLAVVGQDEIVKVTSTWARQHVICDPVQVEATAILWASQLY